MVLERVNSQMRNARKELAYPEAVAHRSLLLADCRPGYTSLRSIRPLPLFSSSHPPTSPEPVVAILGFLILPPTPSEAPRRRRLQHQQRQDPIAARETVLHLTQGDTG